MQKVNCQNFEAKIHETMDQRNLLEHEPALQDHARECSPCLETLRDYVAVEQTLSHLTAKSKLVNSPAPTTVTAQTLRHGRFGTLGLLASLAAGLLICINIAGRSAETPQFPTLSQNVKQNDGDRPAPAQDASRFTPDMSMASNQPEHVPSMSLDGFVASTKPATNPLFTFHTKTPQIRMVSWERITEKLDPLTPYYQYSAEIPGVRPLHSGLNATVELIQKSLAP